MAVKRPGTGATARREGSQVLTLRNLLDRALRGPWRDVKAFASLQSNIKFLNARLGDHAVEAITADVLENFAARMAEQGYAAATIKRRLDTLGRALTLAVRWGIIPARPPMPEVRVRNTKERVLTPEEEAKVFAAIRRRHEVEPWRRWDEFDRLVTVLLQTGGRLGEVLGLKREDYRSAAVTFPRYGTKNDKPRTIPLTPAAFNALSRQFHHQPATCTGGGCKVPPFWTFTTTKAWFFWSIIRQEVGGLDDVTLHTLRHTTLTRLAQGGMDLMRLQKWAGHSDPRITAERYTHLQPSDLVGGLDILERKTI